MCGIPATLTNQTPAIQLWDSSAITAPYFFNVIQA